MENLKENKDYLTKQIITYLGNKRSLLNFIYKGLETAKKELKKDKVSFLDAFSGSGVVSRFAKAHSNYIVANDLEDYSRVINECYLANADEIDFGILKALHESLNLGENELKKGFISRLYAPQNDKKIQHGERVFYTARNAAFLDTMRQKISQKIPSEFQHFFIAPLIYEASVHSNTGGVFKGFYKDQNGVGKFGGRGENALSRIVGHMQLEMPIFSHFNVPYKIYQKDVNELAKDLDSVDVAYFDPPYNQHPYGSNYFMLNLIANYVEPSEISQVSGIPKEWNHSHFNKAKMAEDALFELISDVKAKIVLLSYNCEGFVKRENFEKKLRKLGDCKCIEQEYNTFRASRNLASRPTHVKEQLYVLVKG